MSQSAYFVMGYVMGIVSILGIIRIMIGIAPPEKEPEEELKVEDMAAQFIDPDPLINKLKDGTTLNEITE